jgi:AbrB family looped-hinge helix DNA binding protein
MAEVTLSAKNQIVIPRDARQALGLKAGDKLLTVVRGSRLLLLEKPQRHSEAIQGLMAGQYGQEYVEKERRTWD